MQLPDDILWDLLNEKLKAEKTVNRTSAVDDIFAGWLGTFLTLPVMERACTVKL